MRFLTDASGAVTDTYTYDAFGALTGRTGSTPNEYLYAGERYDAETGFYHLRARYMRPETGRFFSMDSYGGNLHEPLSLHKYLYANDDAVNRIDPSGNFSVAELNVTLSISNILAAEASLTLGTVETTLAAEFIGETALVASADAVGVSASGSALTSALAFLGSAALGTAIATSGSGSDSDKKEEHETFYRVMSEKEYNGLGPNGEITIKGTENFVTQSPEYVLQLAARKPYDYHYLVVYTMQEGTRSALVARGARSNNVEDLDPSLRYLRHISEYPKNAPNVVHIKNDLGAVTYGLRPGTVSVFNSRIVAHQGVRL